MHRGNRRRQRQKENDDGRAESPYQRFNRHNEPPFQQRSGHSGRASTRCRRAEKSVASTLAIIDRSASPRRPSIGGSSMSRRVDAQGQDGVPPPSKIFPGEFPNILATLLLWDGRRASG